MAQRLRFFQGSLTDKEELEREEGIEIHTVGRDEEAEHMAVRFLKDLRDLYQSYGINSADLLGYYMSEDFAVRVSKPTIAAVLVSLDSEDEEEEDRDE
jgi:hypothetical protein